MAVRLTGTCRPHQYWAAASTAVAVWSACLYMLPLTHPWEEERFSLGGAAPRPVRRGSAVGIRAGK